MDDTSAIQLPERYEAILARSRAVQFPMNSDLLTGSLLRTLAASKPGGTFLELGTGAGLGTSWILAGMDARSSLVSVEKDAKVLAIAREEVGGDARLTLLEADGAAYLESCTERYDFIYADTWPGKYTQLELALNLVKSGGIFLVDDMLRQPNWPVGHEAKVPGLIAKLESLPDFWVTKFSWSTGLILCVKR
jgi:predicted O-methyltransferase YrrM